MCAVVVAGIPVAGKERTDRAELAELEAKVGTMYLVQRLALSKEQKDDLLAVRKRIAPAAAEYLRRRQEWRASTGKAVEDFVEFSTRSGEFPPKEIQDGLWKYDGEWQAMPCDFRRQVGPATGDFADSVTPSQAALLKQVARETWRVIGAEYTFVDFSREDETDADSPADRRAAATSQRSKVDTLSRAGYLCAAPYLEEALQVAAPDFPHWWDMKEEIAQQKRIGVTHTLTFFTSVNLEREQLEGIIKCLRRYLPLTGQVAAYEEDLSTREGKAYLKALERAERTLERGRSFSPQDMGELRELKKLWLANQGKASSDPNGNSKRQKAIQEICETVRSILKESQTARMLVTEDCPIPSPSKLGVSRAGQVAADRIAKIGAIVDEARKRADWGTPACEAWWRRQVAELSGGLHVLERMSSQEKSAAYAEATAAVEKARAMEPARYLAERDGICSGLMALDLTAANFQNVLRGAESEEGKRKLLDQKIYRFFVAVGPILLPLAEARLEHIGVGQTKR